jgi:hypothetical protein
VADFLSQNVLAEIVGIAQNGTRSVCYRSSGMDIAGMDIAGNLAWAAITHSLSKQVESQIDS